jgi:hypothetical protein
LRLNDAPRAGRLRVCMFGVFTLYIFYIFYMCLVGGVCCACLGCSCMRIHVFYMRFIWVYVRFVCVRGADDLRGGVLITK